MFEVYTYLPFSSLFFLMANKIYFVINENKALEYLTVQNFQFHNSYRTNDLMLQNLPLKQTSNIVFLFKVILTFGFFSVFIKYATLFRWC